MVTKAELIAKIVRDIEGSRPPTALQIWDWIDTLIRRHPKSGWALLRAEARDVLAEALRETRHLRLKKATIKEKIDPRFKPADFDAWLNKMTEDK